MTIPSTPRKAGPLLGDGAQTEWPFAFKVFAGADVQVTIADADGVETVLTSNYSVELNANQETSPGGTVTYPVSGTELPTGSVLSITGNLDYDQPLDLPGGGNFSPLALENQLDRMTMQMQQLAEEVDRAARLPVTSTEDADALVADLVRLADSADNIDTVAGSIGSVNTVAPSIADVNTVAAVAGAVVATAANIAAVVAVGNDLLEPTSEVNTVAGSIANVNTVGDSIADVNTVAGIDANVTTVAGIAADVTAVAGMSAEVTNFADVYQGAKTADPTLRNDSSALQVGDLYFNTTEGALRAYSGTLWVAGTAGTVSVTSFSGDGIETEFALPTAPASENNTQVYVSGVYQQKDQYSVSGVTLTFTAAPPAGTDNIEVVTIATLALGETDAPLVSYTPAGEGAVATDVQSKLREFVSVKDFNGVVGDGINDDTAGIQAALNAITSGVKLIFPPGEYKVTDYLTVTGKTNFAIIMDGVVVPTGTLSNVSTGLFRLSSCTFFRIKPNVVNASYASTLNCFYLAACTDWAIDGGQIDVKYNAIDATAAIQIVANTKRGSVARNYIRAGYGVLTNNIAGVSDIAIEGNDFVGQVAYGNTGPGDAVEFNTPTYTSSNIRVVGNRFSGFAPVLSPQRYLVTGFANVQGLLVEGNTFSDISGCIAVHVEDGTSYAGIRNNKILSGHIGVHVVVNTSRSLYDISVTDNTLKMPTLDAAATYDNDAGITLVTNQLAGGGEVRGLVVSNNTLSTASTARYGIVLYDHQQGLIADNKVTGFATTNIEIHPANASSAGIHDSAIKDNISTGVGTPYKISRGAPNSTYSDVFTFRNVLVEGNIADTTDGAQPINDYYISGYDSSNKQPTYRHFVNGKNVATDSTATTAFTLTVPNVTCQGTMVVKYHITIVGQANRVTESGSYTFAFGRVAGANLKIAAAAKTGNAQIAINGAGTITASMAAAAVSGGAAATNTVAIEWTSVDGTANVTKAGSECVFEVEMYSSGGLGGGQLGLS